MVDRAIQSCPIDTRRGLYSNIVLSVSVCRITPAVYIISVADAAENFLSVSLSSPHHCADMPPYAVQGGSTMFKDFGRRVQRDIQRAVSARQVLLLIIALSIPVALLLLLYHDHHSNNMAC